MKKFGIQVVILLIVILGALYTTYNPVGLNSLLTTNPVSNSQGVSKDTKKLKVGDAIVNIEVAQTSAQRKIGLSGRESLDADTGMLFIFDETKKHQFWMKEMKLSLDFIFIKKGKVVDLLRNIDPPTEGTKDSELTIYEPVTEIDMLLEVNSGYIDKNNIKVGDTVGLIK